MANLRTINAALALFLVVSGTTHAATYYRCMLLDGSVEFTQRPCVGGGGSTVAVEDRLIGWESPGYAPLSATSSKKSKKSSKAKLRVAQKNRKKREKACFKKKQSLENVNRRLRAGYKAGQGKKLRHRRRQIEEYLDAFCV